MQLTVFFNNSKAKQVINMSDKFSTSYDNKFILSEHELRSKARDLAIYIGGGSYLSHTFDYYNQSISNKN